MASAPLKPGDLVRTPGGRTAVVTELRGDGRRDVRFVDGDRDEAALRPELLVVVARAPVIPWKRHRL